MYLKLADRLVKQGDYAGALQAIAKARQVEPGNRYAIAYEERVRLLLQESEGRIASQSTPLPLPPSPLSPAAGNRDDFPTVEKQIRKIATVLPSAKPKDSQPDSKDIAIMAKVASLLNTANQYLTEQRFSLALEAVARATLLDPRNKEIRTIEERIRTTQEEERTRAGRLREEREVQEKKERDRALQEELERLKFEREQIRQDQELQKRTAQEKKIEQSLRRASDFLSAGQIDEAQCEYAFVSVLAPGTPEVQALETELTRYQQERERQEQDAYRRRREEERTRAQQLREEIAGWICQADEFSRHEQFSDALQTLTEAYLRDPTNKDIEACENRILNARKVWEENRESHRRQKEEEARSKALQQEEERRQQEWATLRQAVIQQEEEQSRKIEVAIAGHLQAARLYLEGDRLKEALAEVALAFVLNPLHPDVKAMEQEISQRTAPPAARRPPDPVTLSPEVEANLEAIAKHLAGAKLLFSQRRFAAAMFEANQALALDPENVAARRLVTRISREQEAESKGHKESSRQGSGSSRPSTPPVEPLSPASDFPQTVAPGDSPQPSSGTSSPAPIAAEESVADDEGKKHWLKKLIDRLATHNDKFADVAGPEAGNSEAPPFPRPDSDLDSLRGGVSY